MDFEWVKTPKGDEFEGIGDTESWTNYAATAAAKPRCCLARGKRVAKCFAHKKMCDVKFQWTWQEDISLLKGFLWTNTTCRFLNISAIASLDGDNAWQVRQNKDPPCCNKFSLSAHKALLDINDTAGRCRSWVDPPGFRTILVQFLNGIHFGGWSSSHSHVRNPMMGWMTIPHYSLIPLHPIICTYNLHIYICMYVMYCNIL